MHYFRQLQDVAEILPPSVYYGAAAKYGAPRYLGYVTVRKDTWVQRYFHTPIPHQFEAT